MKHTPYGYDIKNGKIVVNEEKARIIRKICENYLSGMGLVNAAREEGLKLPQSSVSRLMMNPKYLGTDIYPPILTKELVDKVKEERKRRSAYYGRDNLKKKEQKSPVIHDSFVIPKIEMKYSDPVKQAEYAYGCIRIEVNN